MIEDTLLEIAKVGGPVTVVLVIMYGLIRYLIKTQSERDKQMILFIERQETSFKSTIDNHLDAQKKAMGDLTAVTDKQNKVSGELLDYLKKCNGK